MTRSGIARHLHRVVTLGLAAGVLAAVAAHAQLANPNTISNPYETVPGVWVKLPAGREWGATSTVYYAGNGKLWVAERCGANTNCLDTPDIDPIMLVDTKTGKIEKSFGRNMIVWPHGIFVDHEGNVWMADARGDDKRKKGHQVHKFSPDGKLVMSLGKAGVEGKDEYTFNEPNDVLVAPSGDIFVAEGHSEKGANRIIKYDKHGKYIKEFGGTGREWGQLLVPHDLAMDSQGRLFVADRSNNRVQIFDQEGNFIDAWTQFGRPSGLYIDNHDILYVADSESNTGPRRNPGWYRGIRIGSAKTGWVHAFIPDPNTGSARGTSAAEGVTADEEGHVYGAEVAQKMLRKYVLTK